MAKGIQQTWCRASKSARGDGKFAANVVTPLQHASAGDSPPTTLLYSLNENGRARIYERVQHMWTCLIRTRTYVRTDVDFGIPGTQMRFEVDVYMQMRRKMSVVFDNRNIFFSYQP